MSDVDEKRSGAGVPAPDLFIVGRVLGARGLRGELKVEVLTDFPQRFVAQAELWIAGRPYRVSRARLHKGLLLLSLEGVSSPEQAASLAGLFLEVPRSELQPLPAGHYYLFQIIGLEVITPRGESLGKVVEVLSTGSNDVYVVRGSRGEILLPATAEVVREVDVEGGRMVVELMEGLGPG